MRACIFFSLMICAAISGCAPGSGRVPEESAERCSDGVDNDGDRLVDCSDSACLIHRFCRDAPTEISDGGPRPDRGIPPPLSCTDPIDVVFVIDVSTSMRDEVNSIRTGVDRMWHAAQALTPHTQFSLVVFVDDVVAVNGCTPFSTIEAMQAELMEWQEFTTSNEQPAGGADSNNDCAENSLDALHAAASQCPWRSGALHVVIHITDDTFEERPAHLSGDLFSDGIAVQHTYGETVTALVADQVRVGAFAAPQGEYCGAGTSADVGRGFFTAFGGSQSIPSTTGGAVWSIREVRAGTLDMAEAINQLIQSEHCTLF